MQGIYVKDMEMPKDCPMYPMAHWNAFNIFSGCEAVPGKKYAIRDPEYANSSTRPDWCPPVNIPPHGRLIDADAELERLKHCMFPSDMATTTAVGMYEKWLKNAPTVIPAEEGET